MSKCGCCEGLGEVDTNVQYAVYSITSTCEADYLPNPVTIGNRDGTDRLVSGEQTIVIDNKGNTDPTDDDVKVIVWSAETVGDLMTIRAEAEGVIEATYTLRGVVNQPHRARYASRQPGTQAGYPSSLCVKVPTGYYLPPDPCETTPPTPAPVQGELKTRWYDPCGDEASSGSIRNAINVLLRVDFGVIIGSNGERLKVVIIRERRGRAFNVLGEHTIPELTHTCPNGQTTTYFEGPVPLPGGSSVVVSSHVGFHSVTLPTGYFVFQNNEEVNVGVLVAYRSPVWTVSSERSRTFFDSDANTERRINIPYLIDGNGHRQPQWNFESQWFTNPGSGTQTTKTVRDVDYVVPITNACQSNRPPEQSPNYSTVDEVTFYREQKHRVYSHELFVVPAQNGQFEFEWTTWTRLTYRLTRNACGRYEISETQESQGGFQSYTLGPGGYPIGVNTNGLSSFDGGATFTRQQDFGRTSSVFADNYGPELFRLYDRNEC